MSPVQFIKSFSKGQVTIPKSFREAVGIGDDFWLKLTLEHNKIIAEPVASDKPTDDYLKNVLSLKGDWFSYDEWKKTRQNIEKRLKRKK